MPHNYFDPADEKTVVFPVSLVLKMFNAIPKRSVELRKQVIHFLREYKERVEEKGHVAEGFRMLDDGTLVFEESLYDEAVFRGKIETYSDSLYEQIGKLKSGVDLLRIMGDEHQKILHALPPELLDQRVGQGKEISEEAVRLLQKVMPALLALSREIKKD